eukprot:GDKI01042088.1.p1 GENE.GDKI01042088.1~~GDKI01042088.1.p1  ORF type:complete len:486 (+),score=80.56 GDKI01042088.1:1-1458(+)
MGGDFRQSKLGFVGEQRIRESVSRPYTPGSDTASAGGDSVRAANIVLAALGLQPMDGSGNHPKQRDHGANRGWNVLPFKTIQQKLDTGTKEATDKMREAVFTFGQAAVGQLGVPERITSASHVVSVDSLRVTDVVGIAAGGLCSFVVTDKGKVMGFGSNRYTELGLRREQPKSLEPQMIKFLREHKIVQVACSPSVIQTHTLALSSEGLVFAFGSCTKGALGLGPDTDNSMPSALPMTRGMPIRQVAVGARHSLLLTDTGMLYTCGDGRSGQLGHGDFENRFMPARVDRLAHERVHLIAGGDEHTVVSCESGTVYAWGEASSGQLGGGKLMRQSTPQIVPTCQLSPVSIAAGSEHTILSCREQTFVCGSNGRGQLGLGRDKSCRLTLVPIPKLNGVPITQVCAASSHSLALAETGEVYAFGDNSHGQLGFLPPHSSKFAGVDPLKLVGSAHGQECLTEPTIINALNFVHTSFVATAPTHTICMGC